MYEVSVLNHNSKPIKISISVSQQIFIKKGGLISAHNPILLSINKNSYIIENGQYQTLSIPNDSINIYLTVYIQKSYSTIIKALSFKITKNTDRFFEFIGNESDYELIEINKSKITQSTKSLYFDNSSSELINFKTTYTLNGKKYTCELPVLEGKKQSRFIYPFNSSSISLFVFIVNEKLDTIEIANISLGSTDFKKCYNISKALLSSKLNFKEFKC